MIRTVTGTAVEETSVPPSNFSFLDDLDSPSAPPTIEDRLKKILDRHRQCTDDLSKKLRQWGNESLDLSFEHLFSSEEEIALVAGDRLNALWHLLKDPLTGQMFNLPLVKERHWLWSKYLHDFCRSHMDASPYDGQPMSEELPRHLFAEEIIEFVSPFFQSSPSKTETRVATSDPELVRKQLDSVKKLAKSAEEQRLFRQMREEMSLAIVQHEELMVSIRIKDQAAEKRQEVLAAAHLENVQKSLVEIKNGYENRLKQFQQQLEFVKETYANAIASLEMRMQTARQANQAEAESLTKQIANAHQSYQNTIGSLQTQIANEQRSNSQNINRLESQLHSAEQSRREANEAQQKAASDLQKKILENTDQTARLAQELNQQRTITAQHTADVQGVRADNAAKDRLINQLQGDLHRALRDAKKSGICAIL